MAVYLQCERCGGSSYGDQYCETCEANFLANPESRPPRSDLVSTSTDIVLRRARLLRLGRATRNVVMTAAALTFAVSSIVFLVQWISGWGDEGTATPQPASSVEKVQCSDTFRGVRFPPKSGQWSRGHDGRDQ